LHGDETVVFGDAGYQGVDKRPEFANLVLAGRTFGSARAQTPS
jgi:hypothetical protein